MLWPVAVAARNRSVILRFDSFSITPLSLLLFAASTGRECSKMGKAAKTKRSIKRRNKNDDKDEGT
jgi:hypothetical protein